jgi:periplasmic divalent cation tolerance protein
MDTGCVQVVVAVDTEENAARIAEALVAERLAACVQVGGPVTSRYHWEGKVETEREYLLIVKTRDGHVSALTERVRELHPYEVPEITAVPITGGLGDYLDWIRSETA